MWLNKRYTFVWVVPLFISILCVHTHTLLHSTYKLLHAKIKIKYTKNTTFVFYSSFSLAVCVERVCRRWYIESSRILFFLSTKKKKEEVIFFYILYMEINKIILDWLIKYNKLNLIKKQQNLIVVWMCFVCDLSIFHKVQSLIFQ